MDLLKRTWADIDLDCLEHNFQAIKSRVPDGTRILGVVKADAYGHGAVQISRSLTEFGAGYLAVSNLEEAVQIRRGGISTPILILGYTPAKFAEVLVEMHITQEIHSLEYACELDSALAGAESVLNVHMKLDTGMSRIGFFTYDQTQLEKELTELAKLKHLHIEGVFTHFSSADGCEQEDVAYTDQQYLRFTESCKLMETKKLPAEIRHCCNSGAIVLHPDRALDMVRAGIVLYGLHPSAATEGKIELQPVMSLRSIVAQIRKLKSGTAISYGRTYVTDHDTTVAVIPVGYADGLNRGLSGQYSFLLHGKLVPILGRICMDMCMVDISDVPETAIGDEVTVFGRAAEGAFTCTDLAEKVGSIPYETICGINMRVPRIYHAGGREVGILQYIV